MLTYGFDIDRYTVESVPINVCIVTKRLQRQVYLEHTLDSTRGRNPSR